MRVTGIIIMFFALGFATFAQTKEVYEVQPERAFDLSKSVQIFPNPATEFVHIRLDLVPVQNLTLSLHNIIGNEISVETETVNEHEFRVRVKDLASGYYLLALKDEQDKFRGTYKFLKR